MTLQSVFLVVGCLGSVWQAASEESKVRFVERLGESASDEERQEVSFPDTRKEAVAWGPRAA
jgi:hypothetical protein